MVRIVFSKLTRILIIVLVLTLFGCDDKHAKLDAEVNLSESGNNKCYKFLHIEKNFPVQMYSFPTDILINECSGETYALQPSVSLDNKSYNWVWSKIPFSNFYANTKKD